MPRYTQERKDAVLKKLLPPNNLPVSQVADAEGISLGTLYHWLSQAKNSGQAVPGSRSSHTQNWSGEARFAVVLETASMNEAEIGVYCREKGLYPEQIAQWRLDCIAGASSQSHDKQPLRAANNEIKRLKRQVNRKDKALAESAALLVLSKKFQALWEDEES